MHLRVAGDGVQPGDEGTRLAQCYIPGGNSNPDCISGALNFGGVACPWLDSDWAFLLLIKNCLMLLNLPRLWLLPTTEEEFFRYKVQKIVAEDRSS